MTAPYKTLTAPCGPVLLRERKSKFLGFAFPARSREEVGAHLEGLRAAYPDATHICYAFRIGLRRPETRMHDDGEPSYSAGAPIFGQIEAFDLHNVLICVVRYYGGTKLGVGGLVQAYRETARSCLQEAPMEIREPSGMLKLHFGYECLDAVMRTISQQQLAIDRQQMQLRCQVLIRVPAAREGPVLELFRAIPGVDVAWEPPEGG